MIKTALDHQLNIQHVFDIPPTPNLKNHEGKMEKPWSHGWEEKEGGRGSELESYQSVF